MNYKIKVYKTKNNEWNTKAYVSVTFNDCFIVTGITVREGNNNSLFVAKLQKQQDKRKREANIQGLLQSNHKVVQRRTLWKHY